MSIGWAAQRARILLQEEDNPEYSEEEIAALAEGYEDPAVKAAKDRVKKWFSDNPNRVVYQQQLTVLLEREFFHWITRRAVEELVSEGKVLVEAVPMRGGGKPLRFYRTRSHRNWRRQALETVSLVESFSPGSPLGDSLGAHGEMMLDAGLAGFGFVPAAKKVKEWKGVGWSETAHDLDRVYVKDGLEYGAEIKNTLKYIPLYEFEIKLKMCATMNLRPLFISRFAPKTYNYRVIKAGGYAMLFGWQLYPFGFKEDAEKVARVLGLPVRCPVAIEDGTFKNFQNWHEKVLKG